MIFKKIFDWYYFAYFMIWLVTASAVVFVVYAKPDVHCVLKSRTTFAENKAESDCQYTCENGRKSQVILSKRYKCPALLFEKDRS